MVCNFESCYQLANNSSFAISLFRLYEKGAPLSVKHRKRGRFLHSTLLENCLDHPAGDISHTSTGGERYGLILRRYLYPGIQRRTAHAELPKFPAGLFTADKPHPSLLAARQKKSRTGGRRCRLSNRSPSANSPCHGSGAGFRTWTRCAYCGRR